MKTQNDTLIVKNLISAIEANTENVKEDYFSKGAKGDALVVRLQFISEELEQLKAEFLNNNVIQDNIVIQEDEGVVIESKNIFTVVKYNDIGISIDVYDMFENLISETQFHFDDYAGTCPECGTKLKHAMLDIDGTNLEEVLECTNSECTYYTFDLSGDAA